MKMLFTLAALLFCINCYSQSDTSRIEQYCELIADNASLLNRKTAINVNYGEERKARKDYRLTDENGKLVTFNSVVDAMNFLGKQGWKLASILPVSFDTKVGSLTYHYIFKKDFVKSELSANNK